MHEHIIKIAKGNYAVTGKTKYDDIKTITLENITKQRAEFIANKEFRTIWQIVDLDEQTIVYYEPTIFQGFVFGTRPPLSHFYVAIISAITTATLIYLVVG